MFAGIASRRWAFALVTIVLIVAAVGGWFVFKPKSKPVQADDSVAIEPLSSSPFLNTQPDAEYVGTPACIRCHTDEHQSFQRTGMARSTAKIRLDKEPPDGFVDHVASGRRIESLRQNGELRHRDWLLRDGKPDVMLNDFAVKYVVGSGRYARTYTAEADGFLVESPITYFTSRQAWGMSPGFDQPHHKGFERAIGTQCLFCHVGRFEVIDQSVHRYRIIEAAIGCERCHGPGSLHIAKWDKPQNVAKGKERTDFTIVNPRWLPRDLAEAVCQQCHLTGDLMVMVRGRKMSDFRPGLPLQDVLMNFRLADSGRGMTVTGHVEQLHQSKCYQKSETLTCMTCHDPHRFPEPNSRTAYFRNICTGCHTESACKADPVQRKKQSPEDNCVRCHMPKSATDIPHVAFNHHRIGIHAVTDAQPKTLPTVDPLGGREAIESFHDLSRHGPLDQKRALGLAYGKAGAHREVSQAVESYNRRAQQLLSEVWKAGIRDAAVASTLARSSYWLELWDVKQYAEAALRDPDLIAEDRCDMLFLMADAHFKKGRYAEAAELLRQNTQLRRDATDWSYWSKCERALGHEAEGLKLLEKAAEIGSTNPRYRQELVEGYEKLGDRERADWHRRRLPEK